MVYDNAVSVLPESATSVVGLGAQAYRHRLLRACERLSADNFLRLTGEQLRSLLLTRDSSALADWIAFERSWSGLPIDTYMADAGTYRRRRYATLSAPASTSELKLEPHQPHYQSLQYNSLNGGIARHFQPIARRVMSGATMSALLTLGCNLFGRVAPFADWHIEVHQFRIEVDGNAVAPPTPEGIHRDGVDFAMMIMIRRANVTGGETQLYDEQERPLLNFRLTDPLDITIVNDQRDRHGVTPISAAQPGRPGHRDVLVATFRSTSLDIT